MDAPTGNNNNNQTVNSDRLLSFYTRYRDMGLTGVPWDESDIALLEEHLGLPIPVAYRAYLLIAGGSYPPALVGSDCSGDYVYKLREWAIILLRENDNPFRLPDDAIVFFMHQGYQFCYFHADGITDDPPVYYYLEGDTESDAQRMIHERFTDWVDESAINFFRQR